MLQSGWAPDAFSRPVGRPGTTRLLGCSRRKSFHRSGKCSLIRRSIATPSAARRYGQPLGDDEDGFVARDIVEQVRIGDRGGDGAQT